MVDQMVKQFKEFSTFDIAYVEGLTFPMDRAIKPLTEGTKVLGRAFTVNEKHAICMNIFQEIGEGEVLVVAGKDETEHGGCGVMICELLRDREAVGAVIDGGAQDTGKIKESGFPVFCRYVVPTHGQIKLKGEINVPIECGGVNVRPGDLIIGDDDGVVVIPKCNEERVLEAVKLMREARDYVDGEIEKGKKLWEIEGVVEMWAQKEKMGKYHWEVYKQWNEKYIKGRRCTTK